MDSVVNSCNIPPFFLGGLPLCRDPRLVASLQDMYPQLGVEEAVSYLTQIREENKVSHICATVGVTKGKGPKKVTV